LSLNRRRSHLPYGLVRGWVCDKKSIEGG
jgi:hypothetical protein